MTRIKFVLAVDNYNKMQKFDWKETINVNILMLKCTALWPKDDESYKMNFYTLYATFSLSLFLGWHNIFQIINLFFIYNDLKALTASLFLLLTEVIAALKAYFLILNMKKLKEVMIILNSDLFQPKNMKQRKLIEPDLKFWKLIYAGFWTCAIFTLIFWAIFPILDESQKRLPFLAWYPFNTEVSPTYEFTYIYQMVSITFLCTVNLNIDTLIAALNMYIGAQCDILCDNLRNLHLSNDVKRTLIECIVHYKEIVSFARETNKFYDFIVLIQFFTSGVSIGLTMFQLTLVPAFSSEFCSFVFYGTAVTVQIFMYCWFGNEVIAKSSNILYAAFEAMWTDESLEVKKILIIFMLRCQIPIQVSAVHLFSLSVGTFVKILRTAWSYFAVLNQVNSN